MALVRETYKRKYTWGKYRATTGKFTDPGSDFWLDTGLRRIIWFEYTAVGGAVDNDASCRWNSTTNSAVQDDPGQVFIATAGLSGSGTYFAVGVG